MTLLKDINKVILVTGSNTGIGYELVRLLAAQGHTVYLASRKEEAGHEAVAKIKEEKGLEVKFVQLDVTDSASIAAAAAKIQQDDGRLNVLVNNAGVSEMYKMGKVSAADLDSLHTTFNTNFFGLIATTTAFLPLLRASNSPDAPSVILNVSSDMASNGFMAGPKGFLHEAVAYNTSKGESPPLAANSYTIALAHELQAEGIKVNCATPGFTTTKMNGFTPGGKTPEQGATLLVEWSLLGKDGKTGKFAFDGGEWQW